MNLNKTVPGYPVLIVNSYEMRLWPVFNATHVHNYVTFCGSFLTGDSMQCVEIPETGYMCQCTVEGEIIPLNGTECIGEWLLSKEHVFLLNIKTWKYRPTPKMQFQLPWYGDICLLLFVLPNS